MPADHARLTIAMVAGEASGDNLGAALVHQIRQLEPDCRFLGIGGPAMVAEGFSTLDDIERLSVNGIVDPLMRLPSLIRLLWQLRDHILDSDADCFVGIDFNFFNLLLAGMLRKRGIKTIQYVSPTVWAWRQGRVRKIARKIDLMMTLYPFETEIYQRYGIPVEFVGHPRAVEIPLDAGRAGFSDARQELEIADSSKVLAILPGSRSSEVNMSGRDFLAAARLLKHAFDVMLIPAANEKRAQQLRAMLAEYPDLASHARVLDGESRRAMTAADVVLVNSGTATLEAMLLRRPMVMSYRLGRLSYAIVSRMVRTKWFALPNILAREQLVPELIQDAATPENLAAAVLAQLEAGAADDLMQRFETIHVDLRQSDAPGAKAAEAVLRVCRATSR